MQRPLAKFGQAVLRKMAEPIAQVTAETKALAQDVIDTMKAYGCVGFASPQIQESKRLIVLRASNDEEKMQDLESVEPRVLINPKVKILDKTESWLEEGNPILPGIQGKVPRPSRIEVEYLDLEGQFQVEVFEGFLARVVLHENDHLNGVLFIDRIDKKERKKLEPQLKALRQQN